MKRLLLPIVLILGVHSAQAMQQQHILDLCQSSHKDNEHCKVITDIFRRQAVWPAMAFLGRIWNYNQAPMPRDLTRGVLMSQTEAFGKQMDWNPNRIEEEWKGLFSAYDNLHKK